MLVSPSAVRNFHRLDFLAKCKKAAYITRLRSKSGRGQKSLQWVMKSFNKNQTQMHLAASFAAAILCCAPPSTGAQTIEGAARVVDGDTLVVAGERIRLFAVDAPEKVLYAEFSLPLTTSAIARVYPESHPLYCCSGPNLHRQHGQVL